jgi:hypothetical protein
MRTRRHLLADIPNKVVCAGVGGSPRCFTNFGKWTLEIHESLQRCVKAQAAASGQRGAEHLGPFIIIGS